MISAETTDWNNVQNHIRKDLDISPQSLYTDITTLSENIAVDLPIYPDLIVEENDAIYFIGIKSKASVDVIAKLNLLRDFCLKNTFPKKIQLAIAAKSFPVREKLLMDQLDITMVKLPWSIKLTTEKQSKPSNHRITSAKSWKIVSRLLKEKKTSIRQLAILEDISYGWAHKTTQALIQQNIVKKENNRVSISNADKLLNGIAWERPLNKLKRCEIQIPFSESMVAAREITRAFSMQHNIPVGFTSYTAAALYTGYGVRNDTVYLYLNDEHIDYFKELFESSSRNSIKAIIYRPDREVFQNTLEKEGVRIVSASQTLLDLAGMGYSAMDITKAMVAKYEFL
ncbi:hypothetical protein [Methanohalophilus portucalensis]|uniref:Uncharacterized protein n=2 Tax=Methanohalophilus portucalensis TaxID=39664 RepID=A0A1L9C4X0_9EURY|nr:hypothetical protein [Methanohalophilus portucalensis]ATU08225.1 hypothetical protein BKM01_05245 [Methanohalophilus portucalensis]OJH49533.1 hypothetical protein MPF_0321 [Methanohalophilus portucalensis FDF-1]SMH35590.1 hypothetical protein SAMN06264941_1014 [Methanohalophilus portucalensis FDF-1]